MGHYDQFTDLVLEDKIRISKEQIENHKKNSINPSLLYTVIEYLEMEIFEIEEELKERRRE
jgi:hypothetical protein